MSLHRRAAKRDANERPIIDALKACGFSVEQLSKKGVGDLLLGRQGVTRLAEVKAPGESLNDDQRAWWGDWRGNACIVIEHVDQVPALAKYWTLLDRNLSEILRPSA